MGTYPIGIVGESFNNEDGSSRQAELARCKDGESVRLVRDPENSHDANCVKVVSKRGVQIGNISRSDDWIASRMDSGKPITAKILSVGTGERNLLGAVIEVSTEDGDVVHGGQRRTGCLGSSAAISVIFIVLAAAQVHALPLPDKAPPFDMSRIGELRRQRCAAEYPDSFTMQRLCQQAEIDGMRRFRDASQRVGRPLNKALERCVEEYTTAGIPNFTLIGLCAQSEADSYLAFNPERG
ncbi:MAG TPA: HIRAN domain-containing protein [Sphingomicrobium sp.]|jgi:hypothetical protein